MVLHAFSIFTSAFLLFLIQPVIARIILPWFGGAASVWATCLMFFQTVLLAGYLYSHLLIRRLRPRRQAVVHIALLGVSLFMLPVMPGAGWKPADGLHPEARILLLLAASVGVPYLLLSTTGPLIQAWYARANPGASPYRLYALANAGSLVALLGYPAAIEPVMRVAAQATLWSVAYVAFVLLCGATAWTTMRRGGEVEFPRAAEGVHPGWRRLALWSALAFCPSALLVAITSHLTQNIAPIPLLWVVPLTLYLLSFILTFESSRWYGRRFWFPLFIASVALMLGFLFPENRNADPRWVIPFFLGGFFICAVTCHGELYRVRPEAPLLTSFYLALSLGGALGGLFVGVLAPSWFNYYYEVPLALLGAVIAVALVLNRGEKAFPGEDSRMIEWSLLTTAALGLLYLSAWLIPVWCRTHRFCDRNFYGVLRVEETAETDTTAGLRELHHGTINHGSQFLEPARRLEPTTYYGPTSGVALAIAKSPFERPRRIGVIGLGTGTLAAYGRPGDWYRFYEINSMVVSVAQREFFYLKDTPANHSIALGDARLSLEREPPQNFDVLAVDAFSGDSIPTHLLTVEAFREYLRHTRPGGVVALHVSNRYLELDKVVAAAVSRLGISACQVEDGDNEAKGTDRSDWVLITGQKGQLDSEEWQSQGCKALAAPNVRMWTDDYSNILDILK